MRTDANSFSRAAAFAVWFAAGTSAWAQVDRTPGELYGIVAPSVVQVETEHGVGSGFIVDEDRLIVTNQHVVHNADFLTVRLGQDRRYRATILVSDVNNDLAIIRVHPDAVRDKPFLALHQQSLRPGDKLFAFGHPLGLSCVMTEGLTSLVASNYVVSDININPGNSGGPITNAKGTVVGVATFSVAAARGPGLSGIVPINLATNLIAEAKTILHPPKQIYRPITPPPPPSSSVLPDFPAMPIPIGMIQEYEAREVREVTIKNPRDCQTWIDTPFMHASGSAKIEREIDRRRSARGADGSVSDPTRVMHPYLPAVVVTISPVLKETDDSKGASFLGALLGVATPREFRYRVDFKQMELIRGSTLVEPVRRSKIKIGGLETMVTDRFDIAYAGQYHYRPEAFEPSERLKIRVQRSNDTDNWIEYSIPERDQKYIYDQFAPYFEFVKNQSK